MILDGPREGLTFGGFSLEWSLKRAALGKGPPLGALRVGFGEASPRGDAAWGSEGSFWNGL